jgi:hypothetical protein
MRTREPCCSVAAAGTGDGAAAIVGEEDGADSEPEFDAEAACVTGLGVDECEKARDAAAAAEVVGVGESEE